MSVASGRTSGAFGAMLWLALVAGGCRTRELPPEEAELARGFEAATAGGGSAARARLADFWRGRGGQFSGLRGRLVDVDTCGVIFTKDGCLEVEVAFDIGGGASGASFTVSQRELDDTLIRDVSGREVALVDSGFTWHRPLSASDPAAAGVARVQAPGVLDEPCVIASGRVFEALQSDDLSPAEFLGVFERIEPCEAPPDAPSVEADWSQAGFLGALSRLSARAEDASSGQREVLWAEARALEARFMEATKGRVEGWRGEVVHFDVRKGRDAEFALALGPSGPPSEGFRLKLWASVRADTPALHEVALKLKDGHCVRFSGTISGEERSVTHAGALREPVHDVSLTALSHCGGSERPDEARNGAAALAGAAMVGAGVAAAGAELAGTTALALIPAVTQGGARVLVLGAVHIEGSALAAAGAGLSAAAMTGLGFYALGKLIDHIDTQIAIEKAEKRAAYASDAAEFLAFAAHVCQGQTMNSPCFRAAFREAATFVASSQRRLEAITADDPARLGEVERRWHDNFKNAHKGNDYITEFFRMSSVARRVLAMSPEQRAKCRGRVDLVHEVVQESLARGRERGVHGSMPEAVALGPCVDLADLEDDYLTAEGLGLAWQRAWAEAGYHDGVEASRGWSGGAHASACRVEEDKLNEDRMFDRTCELHVLDDRIRCVCPDTPDARRVEQLERRADALDDRRAGRRPSSR